MPVPDGSVTSAPEVPAVLNACQTPTEGLPGSPTVAIGIVTTPRFATATTGELERVVAPAEVVLDDDLSLEPPKHPVAPSDSAASKPTNANRCGIGSRTAYGRRSALPGQCRG